jgi:hypothetical protein
MTYYDDGVADDAYEMAEAANGCRGVLVLFIAALTLMAVLSLVIHLGLRAAGL